MMLCLLLASLHGYAQTAADTKLEIYQIKVSEGHATLIVTKNNAGTEIYKSVLIDAGESGDDATLIEDLIKKKAGGKLDVVMVTHHDKDHWGGLPGSNGLLHKRCKSTGSLAASNTGGGGTLVPLDLYYSLNSINLPSGQNIRKDDLERDYGGGIKVFDWQSNLEIGLMSVPVIVDIDIKIKTLAINGLRRDNPADALNLNSGNVKKNKASAIALITWNDFSFLIQGDMYSTSASGKISRTTTDYRRSERNRRLPPQWTGSSVQNAITATRSGYAFSNSDFVRKSKDISKSNTATSGLVFPSDLGAAPHWVGNPEQWHHRLGTLIDENNGEVNEYGHACVALAPHHGATTSNHWFNSPHVLIGSNKNNKNGHPNINAALSLFNTSGASNLYFTYLLDVPNPPAIKHAVNRLTEMRQMMDPALYTPVAGEPGTSGYLPGVNVFFLDGGADDGTSNPANMYGPRGTTGADKLSYYKFTVRNDSQFKVETERYRESETGEAETPAGPPLRTWARCGVH